MLGVPHTATHTDIKRAYRKLARQHHPDLNKAPQAEARFKDIAKAHKVLNNPELRAAYDESLRQPEPQARSAQGEDWGHGFGFHDGGMGTDDPLDQSELFASLFGHDRGGRRRPGRMPMPGQDQHAQLTIDLDDVYQGASRTISLSVPSVNVQGQVVMSDKQLAVNIPKGVRAGQQLRLSGQGGAGQGGGPAGDLYLEVVLRPHRLFKVEGRNVYLDLPVAPWEAALGATVTAPTPLGDVQLTIPANSPSGRQLRLKGKGLPSQPSGDLYAVLRVALPPAETAEAQQAYEALAKAFPRFDARQAMGVGA
jgi:curved DNA-binding protein